METKQYGGYVSLLLVAIQCEEESHYQCEKHLKYLQLTMAQHTNSSKEISRDT